MTRIRAVTNAEAALAVCVFAYLIVTVWAYVWFGSYLEHTSPQVAMDSWRVATGGALFLSMDSEEFSITAYGPLLYLLNAINFSLAEY